MKRVLPIIHEGDLYEVIYEGTKLLDIQHFEKNSTVSSMVQFAHLPDQVRKQLIQKLKNQKGEVFPVLLLLIIAGTVIWFVLIPVGLKLIHNL